MQAILFVLLIGVALYLGARWFLAQDPAKIATLLRSAWKWGLIGLGALLSMRGQFFVGLPFIVMGLAGLLGIDPTRMFGGGLGGGGGAGPKASQVRSGMLEMRLDHGTGAIAGTVRAGRFEGRELSSLDPEELMQLLDECIKAGDQSAALLEAYLDRMHPRWRDGRQEESGEGGARRPEPGGAMTREEALEVLGLSQGADAAAVKSAHKALMKQYHPDRGGSDYLAALINRAKDTLLNG